MDTVRINVTEIIEKVNVSVTEETTPVLINVTEITESVKINVSETIEIVSVIVTEEITRVSIIVNENGGGGGAVDSVNGKIGTVVLLTSDLGEDTDHKYVTDAQQTVIEATSGSNTGDQSSGDFDHGSLQNTHNLTTDVDHNQLTNYDSDRHFLESEIIIPASQVSDFDTEVSNNSAVAANTAKETNVTTDLSEGTTTNTTVNVNSSDGTNATLVSASTLRAGVLTKAKFDEIEVNNSKVSYVIPQFIHLVEAYAPSYTMSNTNGSFRIFPWAVELVKDALFTHSPSSTDITVGATGWYSLYCGAILSGLNNTEYILQYSVNGVAQTLGYDRRSGYGKTTYDTLTLKFNTEVYLTSGQIVAFRVAVPFPGIAGSVTLAPSQIECIMRKLD